MDVVYLTKNVDSILDFINTIQSKDRSVLLQMMEEKQSDPTEDKNAEIILLQFEDGGDNMFGALIKDLTKNEIFLVTSESNCAISSFLAETTGEPKEKFFNEYGEQSSEE